MSEQGHDFGHSPGFTSAIHLDQAPYHLCERLTAVSGRSEERKNNDAGKQCDRKNQSKQDMLQRLVNVDLTANNIFRLGFYVCDSQCTMFMRNNYLCEDLQPTSFIICRVL